MKYYINQFLEWLELTWYLASEPFIQLFNKVSEVWINYIAPKWCVYLYFIWVLKTTEKIGNSEGLLRIIDMSIRKKRLTQKQADKLIEIIKIKPIYKRKRMQ